MNGRFRQDWRQGKLIACGFLLAWGSRGLDWEHFPHQSAA
jgi:hypothetical protein